MITLSLLSAFIHLINHAKGMKFMTVHSTYFIHNGFKLIPET